MKTAKQISIHAGTRIKTLLDEDSQGVIDELVKLNTNFSKLKNPILRKLFAGRVTIADACKIAKCEVDDFLNRMKKIGFLITATPVEQLPVIQKGIDFSRNAVVFELDVRPYLKNNQDPLKEILVVINKLRPGERLKLTNTFEPIPLIGLLTDKGFSYDMEHIDEDTVITWFEKHQPGDITPELTSVPQTDSDQQMFDIVLARFKREQIRYIDVRHLQMPQPMLLILENMDTLPADGLLYIYHKKVPVFLLPELNKRGIVFLLNHKSAFEVDMLIYKS